MSIDDYKTAEFPDKYENLPKFDYEEYKKNQKEKNVLKIPGLGISGKSL
jgi:hypothetical protein